MISNRHKYIYILIYKEYPEDDKDSGKIIDACCARTKLEAKHIFLERQSMWPDTMYYFIIHGPFKC